MANIVINQLRHRRRALLRASFVELYARSASTSSKEDSNVVRITFLRHGQSTWNQQNIFIGTSIFSFLLYPTLHCTKRNTNTSSYFLINSSYSWFSDACFWSTCVRANRLWITLTTPIYFSKWITGMTDTPLTEDGVLEAKTAGQLIGSENLKFDVVYTSLLRRSIKTVWMVLQEIGE